MQTRLFVLEYNQQMVFGKPWSNIKQGLPKHLSKCSGWSLAAVRLDHTGEHSHKPSLLSLVLCQSWQILVWNIRQHDSSSLLQMLFGAGLQTRVHKAQLKPHSTEAQHICHQYIQGTCQLDSSPRCHHTSAPSYTMLAAPELQQKVAVMSKGDKQLLQVKTRFVNAILPKTLRSLLHTKEGCYSRYDNSNGLLP